MNIGDTVAIRHERMESGVGPITREDRGRLEEIITDVGVGRVRYPQGDVLIFLSDLEVHEPKVKY